MIHLLTRIGWALGLSGMASLFCQTAEQKGMVTFLQGTAKKQKIQEMDWTAVQKNSAVHSGDRIRTFSNSLAELDLAQLDRIRLAPKTTIEIMKLYEETKDQKVEANIALQSGDVWANVTKKPEGLKFSISTPVAIAAITGTVLRLHVEPDSSAEVTVYQGEVALQNVVTAKGSVRKTLAPFQVEGPQAVPGPQPVSLDQWSLIVRGMQKAKIDRNGQLLDWGSFSAEDPDEKTDWIRWNQERDRSPSNQKE